MDNITLGCPVSSDTVTTNNFTVCGSFRLDNAPADVRVKLLINTSSGGAPFTQTFDPRPGPLWNYTITGAATASPAFLGAELHDTADCSGPPRAVTNNYAGIYIVNTGPGRTCTGQCTFLLTKKGLKGAKPVQSAKKAKGTRGAKTTKTAKKRK